MCCPYQEANENYADQSQFMLNSSQMPVTMHSSTPTVSAIFGDWNSQFAQVLYMSSMGSLIRRCSPSRDRASVALT